MRDGKSEGECDKINRIIAGAWAVLSCNCYISRSIRREKFTFCSFSHFTSLIHSCFVFVALLCCIIAHGRRACSSTFWSFWMMRWDSNEKNFGKFLKFNFWFHSLDLVEYSGTNEWKKLTKICIISRVDETTMMRNEFWVHHWTFFTFYSNLSWVSHVSQSTTFSVVWSENSEWKCWTFFEHLPHIQHKNVF